MSFFGESTACRATKSVTKAPFREADVQKQGNLLVFSRIGSSNIAYSIIAVCRLPRTCSGCCSDDSRACATALRSDHTDLENYIMCEGMTLWQPVHVHTTLYLCKRRFWHDKFEPCDRRVCDPPIMRQRCTLFMPCKPVAFSGSRHGPHLIIL
jgi:hypothetical protein